MEEGRRFNTILERLQCHREQKHKGHYEQQEKGTAVRDRDVTLGGEESSGISPDVNRVQSRGGCANECQATLPGQGAKNYREMRPLEAAGRCAGPGSTARGSARTDWSGRARESASARRG